MLSLSHVQMIIDVAFFVMVLLLLHQLGKKIAKKRPTVGESDIVEFKRIMAESREVTHQFITVIEENVRVLNNLIHKLDDKEKAIVMLLSEADRSIQKLKIRKAESETIAPSEIYDEVVKMVQQGLNREEISRRSGFTEGEVSLVMELVRAKRSDA